GGAGATASIASTAGGGGAAAGAAGDSKQTAPISPSPNAAAFGAFSPEPSVEALLAAQHHASSEVALMGSSGNRLAGGATGPNAAAAGNLNIVGFNNNSIITTSTHLSAEERKCGDVKRSTTNNKALVKVLIGTHVCFPLCQLLAERCADRIAWPD